MRTIPIYLPTVLADIKDPYVFQYIQRNLVNLYSHLVSRCTCGDVDGVYGETPRAMLAICEIIVWIPGEFEIVARAIVVDAEISCAVGLIGQHSITVLSYNFYKAKTKTKSLLLLHHIKLKERIVTTKTKRYM